MINFQIFIRTTFFTFVSSLITNTARNIIPIKIFKILITRSSINSITRIITYLRIIFFKILFTGKSFPYLLSFLSCRLSITAIINSTETPFTYIQIIFRFSNRTTISLPVNSKFSSFCSNIFIRFSFFLKFFQCFAKRKMITIITCFRHVIKICMLIANIYHYLLSINLKKSLTINGYIFQCQPLNFSSFQKFHCDR